MIFKHYGKSTSQKFWIEKEEKYLVSSTLLQSDALTRYVPLQLTLSGAKKVCSSCQKSLSQTTILFQGRLLSHHQSYVPFFFVIFFLRENNSVQGQTRHHSRLKITRKLGYFMSLILARKFKHLKIFFLIFQFQNFFIFLPTM